MNKAITEKANPIAIVHDHKKDMQLSVQWNRWVLRPIGVWPEATKLSSQRYVYALLNVICIGLISFICIPAVIFVAREINNGYFILKHIGGMSFQVMILMKYFSMIFRQNNIRNGIEHIASDWMNTQHYSDRIIMIRSAKFGRRLVAICSIIMFGGIAFYFLTMPSSISEVTDGDGNLTYWPSIFPVANVIVDMRYTPINEISFWIQCLSGIVGGFIDVGAHSLVIAFAMHAYGRLEVLIQWIEHLVDGREDFCNNVNERLTMIVQQHVRILRFISLTDEVLHEISAVEIVGCTINVCFAGYYLLTEWESKDTTMYFMYIGFIMNVTFKIFIFCYFGELVAEKCREIGEVSYMIDWHRLSGKKILDLLLVIAMSNTSIKLTAWNLIELSLNTFGNVIKSSIAYLNMVRALIT